MKPSKGGTNYVTPPNPIKRRKLSPEEMVVKNQQIKADQATNTPEDVAARKARVLEAYGNANPTQSQILQRSYAAEKGMGGDEIKGELGKAMSPQQVQAMEREIAIKRALVAEIGRPNPLEGETPTVGQSLKNIAPEIGANILQKGAAGAATGAATGAIAGSVVPIIGTAAGAAGGAIAGAVGGVVVGAVNILGTLKEEEKQNVRIAYKSYTTSKTNIKAIIDGINKGALDPVDAVDLYNRELAKIDAAQRDLKALAEREWLTKAKDELVAIESFNAAQRATTSARLQLAIMQPNPNQNFDFGIEELLSET